MAVEGLNVGVLRGTAPCRCRSSRCPRGRTRPEPGPAESPCRVAPTKQPHTHDTDPVHMLAWLPRSPVAAGKTALPRGSIGRRFMQTATTLLVNDRWLSMTHPLVDQSPWPACEVFLPWWVIPRTDGQNEGVPGDARQRWWAAGSPGTSPTQARSSAGGGRRARPGYLGAAGSRAPPEMYTDCDLTTP